MNLDEEMALKRAEAIKSFVLQAWLQGHNPQPEVQAMTDAYDNAILQEVTTKVEA